MDFHVGSLADLINKKTHGKASRSKLFQNISSCPEKEVQFKVIPPVKRKRVSDDDDDEAVKSLKHNLDDDVTSHRPRKKRSQQNNAANAAKRLQTVQPKLKEKIVNPEEDKRTIFVGNLPLNIKVIKLKKMFKSYGEIESARLRCPPVKDPRIPKKVAAIRKEFHPERTNIVGYVRFASEEEAQAALKANGLLYQGHHLRVDLSSRSGAHDQKKAVFVGNLQFGAEENDLWKVFEHCGEIDSIRIVRDSITGVGKGFAYVNFKDLSSVELALKLDGQELRERPLRVNRAVKKLKVKKGSPRVGKQGQGQRFRAAGKGKFAGKKNFRENSKKHFREDSKEFDEKAISTTEFMEKGPERKFKRGGGEKFAGKKQFWEDRNEFEGKGESEEVVKKKKPKLKFKPETEKVKTKLVKGQSEDEPSFQGSKMDEKTKGKVKKKKLSKAELKKQVLSFQLQLKKSGISNP